MNTSALIFYSIVSGVSLIVSYRAMKSVKQDLVIATNDIVYWLLAFAGNLLFFALITSFPLPVLIVQSIIAFVVSTFMIVTGNFKPSFVFATIGLALAFGLVLVEAMLWWHHDLIKISFDTEY